MRSSWWMVLAVALSGCRADVEGMWEGAIGNEDAVLSLDQKGSAITGDVCFGQRCTDIDDGVLDERSLVLTYGCQGCALERATLDLTLGQGLEGEHHLWSCSCTPEEDADGLCMCRSRAHFTRCNGVCGGVR